MSMNTMKFTMASRAIRRNAARENHDLGAWKIGKRSNPWRTVHPQTEQVYIAYPLPREA